MRRARAQNDCGRRRWIVALLFLVFVNVQAGTSLVGEPAPDFALKSTDGKNLRLSEYRGEVVVVSFWASWCGRCLDQLSAVERIRQRHAGEPLIVLSVNLDRKADKAREAEAAAGIGFPVLLDENKTVARRYDPGRLPMVLIIDPTGVVRFQHEGYSPDAAESYLLQTEQLLAEQAGAMTQASMQ